MANFKYDPIKQQAYITSDNIDAIREHFSYENDACIHARRRGAFYVALRKYVITPSGKYDVGLTLTILKFIKNEFPLEENVVDVDILKAVKPTLKGVEAELSMKLRDYQEDIVNTCLKFGRGVVCLATAGGKTLTIANLLERVYKSAENSQGWRVLIIVPDLGLVSQTYSDFAKYNVSFSFSKWTGSNSVDLTTNIVIANIGIIQKTNLDIAWIKDVDMLIVDEVHKCKSGNVINDTIKSIKSPHKFGFTGTLPDRPGDYWNIGGKFGPTIFTKGSHELRVEKYISDVVIHIINISYTHGPPYMGGVNYSDPGQQYRKELEFIATNEFRNNVILQLCNKTKNNTLILVDYINHGVELHEYLTNSLVDKKVFFIQGAVDVDERDNVKQLIESNDNIVCIAISKIFSTGINIINLHYIVFASGGKAKIKTLQSIGRGLRLHKDKQQLTIIDIADQLKYGSRHSEKRVALYVKEQIPMKITNISENNSGI